ncbi:tetratricopeptide repeat protein [Haloferula sp. BvORR071]|uniref:tetratricopeptide repeat protein n=1 Tax=Haloferula sp. BvORR071 TaxID=1396141 RepID=UPI00055683C0|nr:tetratricopeptide repeat protein [Haloferula sp. BvORR071]
MAEVYRSTAQTAGLPENLATVLKWRDANVPLSEEDFGQAMQELSTVVESLTNQEDASSRSIRVLALMVLGNLHRDHGLLDHALPFYDKALEQPGDINDGTPRGKNELANLHTNRGICLLAIGNPEKFPEALINFDAAVELRKDLPLEEDPSFRWGLSAGYMNRGDVLHRLERDDEAVAAYDEAIAHLRQLPYEENPGTRQRYALAWANRGLAVGDPDEARRCFDECISLLENPQNPQQLLTLCNAILNRGRHSLQVAGDAEATAADARQVLELIGEHERAHPAPAEMALQARHLLAHALCVWLDESKKGPGIAEDWIGDCTDTVEDALSVERFWEQQGVTALRPLACDLFALGLHVYRVCQPHFFADFLVESMDPEMSPGAPFADQNFQAVAARALQQAVNEVAQRAASSTLEPEAMAKQQSILKTLKLADHRLAELQRSMQTA